MTKHAKLTLLHSNDLHGAFFPEYKAGHEIGGISRLSGYVKKVRKEEENVIYAVAGDMFRGSIIDSEYLGLSTIELMNILSPDVATVGNHEVDYGLAHLLFLEKCAHCSGGDCSAVHVHKPVRRPSEAEKSPAGIGGHAGHFPAAGLFALQA